MILWLINLGFGGSDAGVQVTTNKVGRRPVIPKKFRNKRLEDLVAALLEEREAGAQNTKPAIKPRKKYLPKREHISYADIIRALRAELAALIEKIRAETEAEIAYRDYLLQIADHAEQQRRRDEDELIAILLMAA